MTPSEWKDDGEFCGVIGPWVVQRTNAMRLFTPQRAAMRLVGLLGRA